MAAAINLEGNLADMDLGIGTDVTPVSPEPVAPAAVEGGKKLSAQAQLNKAMTEQFKDATIAKTNDTLINYNQRYGRAYGFITKTDKTVRLGLKNQFKTDAMVTRSLFRMQILQLSSSIRIISQRKRELSVLLLSSL